MELKLTENKVINEKTIPWIIWSIAGLYYFYEIILRMLPGTMPSEVMHIFKINATQLGIFTAFYYWAYVIMQIPAGLIVDRYSIRKTLFFACLLCIIGFSITHYFHNLAIAEFGRFVIGFGSAFAYVSALKVASIWLPKNHFGLASCIVDSLGMIGAMFTEIVLVHISIIDGYKQTISIMLITGVILALLILLIIRDAPATEANSRYAKKQRKQYKIITKLLLVIRKPQIWLIGGVGCLFYLPSSVVGDVWGIPYLHSVYQLGREQASTLLASFFAGWTIVGPFLGALSDKIQRRCMPIICTILLNASLFSLVIFLPLFHIYFTYVELLVIFFFIGVGTGTHPLMFALAKENYPIKMSGTVVAFTNMLIMLGGLIFQPAVGYLLDFSHGNLVKTGLTHYTANNFTFALSIIPISLMLCLALMFFIKETGEKIAENTL